MEWAKGWEQVGGAGEGRRRGESGGEGWEWARAVGVAVDEGSEDHFCLTNRCSPPISVTDITAERELWEGKYRGPGPFPITLLCMDRVEIDSHFQSDTLPFITHEGLHEALGLCGAVLYRSVVWLFSPAIEDEYSGPQLQDGKVTSDFMVELMKFYKDQKKLHRKYVYQVMKGVYGGGAEGRGRLCIGCY